MSGRRVRAARQRSRQFPALDFPDGLLPNLPEQGYGYLADPDAEAKIERGVAPIGRYLINDGVKHPQHAPFYGSVAAQPAKGPYGRRWRMYYFQTDPNGRNRKERRALANWQRQVAVAGVRVEHEARITKAYEVYADDVGVDLDELIDRRG